ncbi:MAG TPA: sugar ABC transporter permease [Blastocatellia bacterium]|nr:sugar ABC transporter permease [Blastocatellia bacterium]
MSRTVANNSSADFWRTRLTDRLLPYLLLAPAVVMLLALTAYPLVYALEISLRSAAGDWTTANFTRVTGDRFFGIAFVQTLVYTGAALAAEFSFGLILALLLDSQIRARNFFRALLLTPIMLPPVVVGVIWRLMLNPNFGVINGTLTSTGVNVTPLTWLASSKLALLSVIVVDVWQWTPFMFLILLAGLQAIPQEPYEAAMIDGASWWQAFLHITLPLLKPAILVALLLRTIDLLRIFDQIFILTQGGPGFATETVTLYIYKTAFRFFDLGYAAALSLLLLVFVNLVSMVYVRWLRREGRQA